MRIAFTGAGISAQEAVPSPDRTVLPIAKGPFKGKIGLSAKDSVPSYAPPVKAPAGAPNVVVILLDDVGFGASSRSCQKDGAGKVERDRVDR